ncbi:toll/interleukin-1 receptor domain-containing protein [Streptomyces sp. NBC_01356]|uniref:toll/interleukin-1 receptor domain-containing protein n=1 Tax=Streptomyces sp. NBC_01356 TaxID=2903836 RepID=UPI002E3105B1|nr:toll/interleukin-1 receptor domain-containing protein [Streptomyces sp. NBC_01356]
MPVIFVNYRTDDEEGTATLVERELSRRFGDEKVFRASKSISPGSRFPQEILTAVRRCSVLLAVIGPRWLAARSADGAPALADPEDWIRREILEAFDTGALVIPVLVGKVNRLSREELPPELEELADCQYRRLNHRNAESDLSRLAEDLVRIVPELSAASSDGAQEQFLRRGDPKKRDESLKAAPQKVVHHRQRGGIGNVKGDFTGTFVSEPQGPVHTGSGHLYQAGEQHLGPQFSGEGIQVGYVGDNHGTVNQERERGGNCPSDGER